MRTAVAIELSDDERRTLRKWSRGRSTPARLVLRAKIVLAAAAGRLNKEIAVEVGCTRRIVGVWRIRFAAERTAGIEKDAPRPGRPSPRRTELTRKILETTTQEKPAAATHWSTRSLAKELGVSRSRIHRAWQAHSLKPHRV